MKINIIQVYILFKFYQIMDEKRKQRLDELFVTSISNYVNSCEPITLSTNLRLGTPEYEVRFGINTKQKPFTKIDYDHVIKEIRINN